MTSSTSLMTTLRSTCPSGPTGGHQEAQWHRHQVLRNNWDATFQLGGYIPSLETFFQLVFEFWGCSIRNGSTTSIQEMSCATTMTRTTSCTTTMMRTTMTNRKGCATTTNQLVAQHHRQQVRHRDVESTLSTTNLIKNLWTRHCHLHRQDEQEERQPTSSTSTRHNKERKREKERDT